MTQKTARYGYIRDSLDHRDTVSRIAVPESLPTSFSLQAFSPPIYNQYQAGSCTGNGVARAVDMDRKLQGLPFITPSRLFIYYGERAIEGTVNQDAGAQIRDGIKVVASNGVCPESLWPYTINDQQIPTLLFDKPTPACYTDALKFKTLKYSTIPQNAVAVKSTMAVMKRPVVFGFSVFQSFESDEVAATGIVPIPSQNDTPIGGHCVVALGYNDGKEMFLCANSWGTEWGQKGYFQMPYAYLLNLNLASDLWIIQAESREG